MLRFYGMVSIADTLEEIRLLPPSTFAGSKNICLCKENGKFYESNGGNYFECVEINSMLKTQQAQPEVANAPLPLSPAAPTSSTMPIIVVGGQNMDLQTFANETLDTLKILMEFKERMANMFNGGKL